LRVLFISPAGIHRRIPPSQRVKPKKKFLPEEIALSDVIQEEEEPDYIPHLGLLTLAGLLDRDIRAEIIDDGVDMDVLDSDIFDRDYDLVCLSAWTFTAKTAYRIARKFRKKKIPVILGGLHPSAMPDEAAEHVDAIAIGEGEDVFPRMIEDFINGNLKKFYYSGQDVDLKKTPPPRYDLIKNIARYTRIPIQATRGCPRNCKFCSIKGVYGPRYRKKDVEQVMNEIEVIKSVHPYPYILFCDENLLGDHSYSIDLVSAIQKKGVMWECFCDISVAYNEELLELLARSHCAQLLIGLESLRPESLKSVSDWKYEQLDRYEEGIKKIQSYGIGVMGLFIAGLDYDDPRVFDDIKNFIRKTGMFDQEVSVICPIPGSKIFLQLKQEGRIISENWDRYNYFLVNARPKRMSPEELISGILGIYREFFTPVEARKRREHFYRIFLETYGENALKAEEKYYTRL